MKTSAGLTQFPLFFVFLGLRPSETDKKGGPGGPVLWQQSRQRRPVRLWAPSNVTSSGYEAPPHSLSPQPLPRAFFFSASLD